MGVDISVWRAKIGHFHLSSIKHRKSHSRKPLNPDMDHCIIPVLTLLFMSVWLAPSEIRLCTVNEAWMQSNNTSMDLTPELNVTLTMLECDCVCLPTLASRYYKPHRDKPADWK